MFKVYKVVRVESDGRLSSACNRNEFPDEFRVYYQINKVTKPKVKKSMLFAFRDMQEAKDFRDSLSSRHKIYIAESPDLYKNILPQHIYFFKNNKNIFIKFWSDLFSAKKAKKKMDKIGCPMNFNYNSSVCCSSIKLIEELHV